MKFSIIIPVREINNYIRESVPHILAQSHQYFEIIILPNATTSESFPKTTIIPTGNVGPAQKRDLGAEHATGDILAFLDDDAYPSTDWLLHAIKHFEQRDVGAVGGPAVTPDHVPFLERLSGAVYEATINGKNYRSRYLPIGEIKDVDDWPSVNLMVRKDVFDACGGFDSHYYPGEDTKLCLDIIDKQKKIIRYDPAVLVYHHRRNFGWRHFQQLANYGIHRGFFAKVFPQTSLRLFYFIPLLFTLGVLGGIVTWPILPLRTIFLAVLSVYFFLLSSTELAKKRSPLLSLATIVAVFFSHLGYGIGMMIGLLKKELQQ